MISMEHVCGITCGLDNTMETTKLTHEMLLAELDLDLKSLKKWQEEVAGEWNGKDSGLQEEQSMLANEIVDKIGELQMLLEDLDESF